VLRKFESLEVRVGEETEAALSDANDVARMQFIRFRRRLGSLRNEQELQIENLLISTVSKISLLTERVMEAMAKNPQKKLEWLQTKQHKQPPDES
jgi:hypothetical protein